MHSHLLGFSDQTIINGAEASMNKNREVLDILQERIYMTILQGLKQGPTNSKPPSQPLAILTPSPEQLPQLYSNSLPYSN